MLEFMILFLHSLTIAIGLIFFTTGLIFWALVFEFLRNNKK